jgi:hypothetical protein
MHSYIEVKMIHVFCKELLSLFSQQELTDLIKYSSFVAENSKEEINFLLVTTDNFMAEICLSPPECDDAEIVILPSGEATETEIISASALINKLRNSKPVKLAHIDV